MDYLWTPWRYAYVTNAEKVSGCIFCDLPNTGDDAKAHIVHRTHHCYIVLNTYPYTSGHVMIVPFAHADELQKLSADAGHVHMHILPRWVGDTNFMTVAGESRVLPESLEITYERIKGAMDHN